MYYKKRLTQKTCFFLNKFLQIPLTVNPGIFVRPFPMPRFCPFGNKSQRLMKAYHDPWRIPMEKWVYVVSYMDGGVQGLVLVVQGLVINYPRYVHIIPWEFHGIFANMGLFDGWCLWVFM